MKVNLDKLYRLLVNDTRTLVNRISKGTSKKESKKLKEALNRFITRVEEINKERNKDA